MATREKQKPVHEVRIGSIKAAIWANETSNGTRYNVTLARLYKDDENNWQQTESFGRDDLLTLAKVVDIAHTRIHKLEQDARADAAAA